VYLDAYLTAFRIDPPAPTAAETDLDRLDLPQPSVGRSSSKQPLQSMPQRAVPQQNAAPLRAERGALAIAAAE
jgi:hypothetical protein